MGSTLYEDDSYTLDCPLDKPRVRLYPTKKNRLNKYDDTITTSVRFKDKLLLYLGDRNRDSIQTLIIPINK